MTSSNFKIRVSVNDNGGDSISSLSFRLLGSAGQPAIDTMTSTSFVSKNGFIYNLRFGDDTIAIASPNGGETLAVGTAKNILWTTVSGIGNVKIEFSTDSGSTFPNLISYTANSGNFAWNIPDSISQYVRVRVSDSANANVLDVSDANFRIAGGFSLTSPNGGEIWTVGDARTVTWTSTGTISSVRLDYSTDSGFTFPNVITASTANSGSYAWTVPDSIATGIRARVSDGVGFDTSDANFAIRGGFTLTRPNSGDSFQAGTTETVTWSNTGTISTVRLEYSSDSGMTWSSIVASTTNTGSYVWSVPNLNTTQAKVRIVSATDAATADTSDDVFRINPIVLPSPPDTIVIVSGNHALGAPSAALPLTVRVVDTGGSNGVMGARVTFTVTHGSGSLSSPTVYTDASGYATDTLTLGTAAGVYRVEARNDSVTPAKSVVFTVYADGRDVPAGGNTLGLGWRMVGANKNPAGWNLKSTTGGLPNATVYEWDANAADNSSLNGTKYAVPGGDAVRGRAYWVKDGTGGRVFVPSDGFATSDTVQVRLRVGWNQVASGQYFYVSWDSGVTFDTSGVNDTALPQSQRLTPAQAGASNAIQNKVYWYTGSNYIYAPASETPSLVTMGLKPMVGFWVKANQSCTMFILPNPTSPETYATEILNQAPAYLSAGYGQPLDNEWAVQLIATSAGLSDWQNYIGVKSTPGERRAASALEAPPVAAGYVSTAVRPQGTQEWMAASYAEPITAGKTWDVLVASDMGVTTLTWDNVQNLPTQYEAYLLGTSGGAVNLRTASSALVSSATALTLAVGLPEYLAPFLASPLSRDLSFAFPNPATDIVTFKFNLPAAADVSIKIFDVGGRLVRELSASGSAGTNNLTWDTTDKNGQKVGSGVYIYKLESGGNTLVEKLAVVR